MDLVIAFARMKKILIIEDDQFSCFLLREAFAVFAPDWTVWIAEEGSVALRILEKESIDIILTDIMMPVMDGFELIAAVRAKDRDIPIYVISSGAPDLIQERLKGLDVTGYFPKPYDVQTLISLITRGERKSTRLRHGSGHHKQVISQAEVISPELE